MKRRPDTSAMTKRSAVSMKLQKKPPLGKQPNKEVTGELLAHYDREITGGTLKKAEVPRRIAEVLYGKVTGRRFGESAAAIEKRIRRAIEARKKAELKKKAHVDVSGGGCGELPTNI